MNAGEFFTRFKGLFSPLCEEQEWVDVMMQMLSLLPDHVLRRQLYGEYKTWKMTGHTTIQLSQPVQKSHDSRQPAPRPTAASIVAGTARRVRGHGSVAYTYKTTNPPPLPEISSLPTFSTESTAPSVPVHLQGDWARGTPVMQTRKQEWLTGRARDQTVHAASKPKEVIKLDPSADPLADKHWPALDKPAPLPKVEKIEFSSDSETEKTKKKTKAGKGKEKPSKGNANVGKQAEPKQKKTNDC